MHVPITPTTYIFLFKFFHAYTVYYTRMRHVHKKTQYQYSVHMYIFFTASEFQNSLPPVRPCPVFRREETFFYLFVFGWFLFFIFIAVLLLDVFIFKVLY